MCDISSDHTCREVETIQTIQIRSQAGEDGVLPLNIPVGIPNAEFEVVVILQPRTAGSVPRTPEELGWPPGFFEKTVGAIQDPTSRRHDQGEFEERLDLE